MHLAARNVDAAERVGRDLTVRHHANVSWSRFDVCNLSDHRALLDAAADAMGGLDGLLVAVGRLGNQRRAEHEPEHLAAVVDVNLTHVAQLLEQAANRLEAQGSGLLVALSSVAGDRGRPSNYAYGAAKAGLSAFLEGLRGRLHASGVHVLTVKPGPVDTKMTVGMDDLPLLADPGTVADDIVQAIEAGTDVCYTPSVWRLIMAVLRCIPASMFKRLDL